MSAGGWLKGVLDTPLTMWKKREGQPYLQGTARNLGHSFFGDSAANKFEQKYLGDTEQGTRYAYEQPKQQSFIPMEAIPATTTATMGAQQMPQQQNGDQQSAEVMRLLMQRMMAGQQQ